MDQEGAAEVMVKVEQNVTLDVTPRGQATTGTLASVLKLTDANQAAELAATASPVSTCTGISGFLSPNASQTELKSMYEDTCAQLEAARQQRTEVSSELFKYRRIVDELKESQAQLQAEMGRRLQSHRLDVDRLQDVQRELDSLRHAYGEKQSECIELAAKLQQVAARIIAEDQQQQLKEENQLLWQRIAELRQVAGASEVTASENSAAGRDLKSQLQKWYELHVSQPFSITTTVPFPEFVTETVGAIETALVVKLDAAKAETLRYRRKCSQLRKKDEGASGDLLRKEQELESKVNQLSDQLKAAQKESEDLRKSAAEAASNPYSDSVPKVKQLKAELAALKSQLHQNEIIISESKIDREQFGKKLELSEQNLKEAQELLTKDREDFRERNEEWWSAEANFQRQIASLQKANETLKVQLQGLLSEERERIRQLEEQLLESSESADQLQQDLEEMKISLAAAQTEVGDLERQVEQYQEELQEAKIERNELQTELQAARSSITALESEIKDIEGRLTSENARQKEELMQFEKTVAALEKELTEAVNGPDLSTVLSEGQLDSLPPPKQVQKMKAAVLKLVAEKRAKDRQIESYQDDVAELRKVIESTNYQQELKENEWRQEYEGYTENLHKVGKQLEVANQERQGLECELQGLRSKLNAADAILRRQNMKDDGSSGQGRKGTKDRNAEDLHRALTKAEQLEGKCADLMSREKDMKIKTDRLQAERRTLRLRWYGQIMVGMLCCWLAYLYGGLSC